MEMQELLKKAAKPGNVVSISIRPKRVEAVERLKEVLALQDRGLAGDHYKNFGGTRQVTLIQAEHLDAVSSYLNKPVDASLTRRNIVVKGINLLSLKGKLFKIGEALLAYSGECHPCSRMEKNLGTGGYNAMRGHGGITARVVKSGLICEGDLVSIVENS